MIKILFFGIGAIDGKHIVIQAPVNAGSSLFEHTLLFLLLFVMLSTGLQHFFIIIN